MKRIIYSAAIAALLVTSCQKTDVFNVVEDVIEFGTEVGKLTKADDEPTTPAYDTDPKYATLVNQGFRVWAVAGFTQGEDRMGEIYRNINNLTVEPGEETWGIVSNQKYYWPQAGNPLYFYTISAFDADWLDDIDFEDNFVGEEAITGLSLPMFTVKPLANDDVMVADSIYQHKGMKRAKRVTPYFRHTMTKVEFNFIKGGPSVANATVATNVVLKGIEISGLANSGILNVTYSTASNKPMSFEWPKDDLVNTAAPEAGEEEKPYFTYVPKTVTETVTVEEEVTGKSEEIVTTIVVGAVNAVADLPKVKVEERSIAVVGDNNAVYEYLSGSWRPATDGKYNVTDGVVLGGDDFVNYVTWYMIPQEIDGQVVTIKYEADGKPIDQDFALEVASLDKDWTEETCVKYNVTIAPHKVVFSPEVAPWEPKDDVNMNN